MPKKQIDLSELSDLLAQGPAGQEKIEKQAQAIKELSVQVMQSYKRQRPYQVPLKGKGNVIRFGLIGDTHIGSLYHREDALRAYYARCREEGVTDILHAGDVLSGWRVYRGQEFELRPDAKSWPEQRDIFVQEAGLTDGMRTVFVTGNHDNSFKKLVGLVPGDEFQRLVPSWKFIGQDIGDVDLVSPDGLKFRVRLLHPGGGTAYAVSYHAQKIVEAMSGDQRPDLIAIGHYHKSLFLPAYRNVTSIMPGCFEDQTPFMIQRSIAAHVGGWIMTVALGEKKHLTTRLQAEWIGFRPGEQG
jgi:predicted phosphodiesterase